MMVETNYDKKNKWTQELLESDPYQVLDNKGKTYT